VAGLALLGVTVYFHLLTSGMGLSPTAYYAQVALDIDDFDRISARVPVAAAQRFERFERNGDSPR